MEGTSKSPRQNPQGRRRKPSVSSITSGTEDEVDAREKKVKQKKKKGIAGKLQDFKVRPKKKQDKTKEREITESLSDMETHHKPHKRHLGVMARIKRFGSRDELVPISPEEMSTTKQRMRHKSSDNDSDAGRHSDREGKPSLFEKLRALSEDSSSDDEDFAKESLSVANRYRRRHGLRRFRANKELNDLAYQWARKLSREQFVNERNAHKYYGRNIYSKQLDNPKEKLNPEEVFDEWYREINLFTFGQNPEDPDITKNATQLLWKNSKEIGIGKSRATDKNIIFVAAYFNPRGNIDNQYKDQVLPLGGYDSRKNRRRSSESSSSEDEAKDKNEEMAQGKSNKKNFLSQVFGKFKRNSDGDSDPKKEKKEHHGFGHRSGKYIINMGKDGKEREEKEKEKEEEKEEEREMAKSNFYVVTAKDVEETKKKLRKQKESTDDLIVFDSKVLETSKNGTKPIGLVERESSKLLSSEEDVFLSSKSEKIEDNNQSLIKVPTLLTNLPTNKKDETQPNGTVSMHLRSEEQNSPNERAIQNQIKRSSSSSDSDDEHHYDREKKSGYTESKASDMLSQIKEQLKKGHDNRSEDDKKVLTEIKSDKESNNIETKVSSDMSKKTGFFSQMKIKIMKSVDNSSSDEDEPSQIVSTHNEDTRTYETRKTLLNSGHDNSPNEEAIQNKNKRSSISSDSEEDRRDHQNHSGYTKPETSDMLSQIKNQIEMDHRSKSSSSDDEKVLTDIKDDKEFAAIELNAPSDVPKKTGIFSKMKSKIMQAVDNSSSDEDESLQVKTHQDKKQPDGIVMQLKPDEHDKPSHGKVVPNQNKRSSISSNSDDDQSKTSAMLSRIKNEIQCSKDNRQSSSSEDEKETSSEILKDKEFTNIETKISSDRSEKTGFFSDMKVKILQSVEISLSDEDESHVEPKENKDSNSENDKKDKDMKPIFVNRRHSSSDEEKRDNNDNRSFSGSLEENKNKNLEEVKEKRLSHTSSDDEYKETQDNDTSIKDGKAEKTGLFSSLKDQFRKRRDSSSDDEKNGKILTATLVPPNYNEFENISNQNQNQDSITFKVQEDDYKRDDHSSSDEKKEDKHIQGTKKEFSLLKKLKNQFRKRNDSSSEEENEDDGSKEMQDLSLLSKTEESKAPVRDLIKDKTSEENQIRPRNKSESSSDNEENIKEVNLSDKSHYVSSGNTPSVPIIPYTQKNKKSSISSASDEENEEKFKEKHNSKQPFSKRTESDSPVKDLIKEVTFEEKLNRTRNKSESSSDDEEKRKSNLSNTYYTLSGNVPSVPIVPYTQRIRKSSISSVSDEENEEKIKEKHDLKQPFSERKESDHFAKEVNSEEESKRTRNKSGSSSDDEGKRNEVNLSDKPHYVLPGNMPSVPIIPYTRRTKTSSISSVSDEDNDKLNLKKHNTTVDQPKNDVSEILTEKLESHEKMKFHAKPNTNDSDSSSDDKAHSMFGNFKKSVVVKNKEDSSNSDEEYETKTSRVITEEVNTSPDIKSSITYGRIQQKQVISKSLATTNKEGSSSSEDENKNNLHEKRSLNNQIHFAHDVSLDNQKVKEQKNASSDEEDIRHVSNLEIKPFNESSSKSSVLDKLKSNFQRNDDSNSSDEEIVKHKIEDATDNRNKNVVSEYKIEINRPDNRGEELNMKRDSVSSTDEKDVCANPNENTKDIPTSKVTKNLGIIDFIKGQFNKKEKDYDKHSSSDEENMSNDKTLADKSFHNLEPKSHFYVDRMDSFSSDDERNVTKDSQGQKEKSTESVTPIEVSQKHTLYGQMKSRLAMKSKEISSSDDEKEDKNDICDNKFVADIETQTKKDKKSSKPGILRKLKDKLIKSEEEIDYSSDDDNQERIQRGITKEVHVNLDETSDTANFVQKEDDTPNMKSVNKFNTTETCLLRKDINDGSSSSSDEDQKHVQPIKKGERDSYVGKLKHVFENLGTTKHGSCEKYEGEFIHEECKTAEYIRQMLSSVNRYRSLHKADKLILNKQLCNFAKERASSFAHGIAGNLNSQFGENIFIYPSSGRSVKDAADLAVEAWYKPAIYHTFGIEPYDYDLKTGPFTQLVWKSSREIGIGIHESSRENRIFVVAIFSPAGNVRGQFTSEVQAPSNYPSGSNPERRKYIDRLI